MWASCRRLRALRHWSYERRETALCALSLLLVCVLSACAFVLPAALLLPLAGLNGLLVIHGLLRRGSIWGVLKLG